MGLQGTLDTFSLAEVLGLIERARHTGALGVQSPDGHGTLYVTAGRFCAGEALPISAPGSGQWAVDLIYHPAETPFLATAAARGARVVGGLGMLVHQAALGFAAMTGHPAPFAAMRAAAEIPST